jgi:hypothetical protein
MQVVSWLSGHGDYTWLRRMSVLSMRSSSAGVNPTVALDELDDRRNFISRMLKPDRRSIWTFGNHGAGVAANSSRLGRVPTTPDLPAAWQGEPVGRLTRSSVAGVAAHEFRGLGVH